MVTWGEEGGEGTTLVERRLLARRRRDRARAPFERRAAARAGALAPAATSAAAPAAAALAPPAAAPARAVAAAARTPGVARRLGLRVVDADLAVVDPGAS